MKTKDLNGEDDNSLALVDMRGAVRRAKDAMKELDASIAKVEAVLSMASDERLKAAAPLLLSAAVSLCTTYQHHHRRVFQGIREG